MSAVVIGMDPHKQSATIEVMASNEAVLAAGRYGTDAAGYREMLAAVRCWPERRWAVEGCQGIGRHIASRLIADGEQVVDVPPKPVRPARGGPSAGPSCGSRLGQPGLRTSWS
jgi:transposase